MSVLIRFALLMTPVEARTLTRQRCGYARTRCCRGVGSMQAAVGNKTMRRARACSRLITRWRANA